MAEWLIDIAGGDHKLIGGQSWRFTSKTANGEWVVERALKVKARYLLTPDLDWLCVCRVAPRRRPRPSVEGAVG